MRTIRTIVMVAVVHVRMHDCHPIDNMGMVKKCGITIIHSEQQQQRHRRKFSDMVFPLCHLGCKGTNNF